MKDKALQRVKKYRECKALQGSGDNVTQSPESVTQYPALLYALVEKRKKLEAICESLGKYRGQVTYGVWGPDFFVVSEMLECTR